MGVAIKVTTGNETVAQATAKVHVFHSPNREEWGMKETYLSAVARTNPEIVRKIGSPTQMDAVVGYISEIGGKWSTQTFEMRDGEILKVFASKKERWNEVIKTACVFLQIRPDAAFRVMRVKLLNISGRTRMPFAEIAGRFDIISLNDAIGLGCTVMPQFYGLFTPAMATGLFEFEVREPEIKAKVIVEQKIIHSETGERRVFQAPRKGRSIEM